MLFGLLRTMQQQNQLSEDDQHNKQQLNDQQQYNLPQAALFHDNTSVFTLIDELQEQEKFDNCNTLELFYLGQGLKKRKRSMDILDTESPRAKKIKHIYRRVPSILSFVVNDTPEQKMTRTITFLNETIVLSYYSNNHKVKIESNSAMSLEKVDLLYKMLNCPEAINIELIPLAWRSCLYILPNCATLPDIYITKDMKNVFSYNIQSFSLIGLVKMGTVAPLQFLVSCSLYNSYYTLDLISENWRVDMVQKKSFYNIEGVLPKLNEELQNWNVECNQFDRSKQEFEQFESTEKVCQKLLSMFVSKPRFTSSSNKFTQAGSIVDFENHTIQITTSKFDVKVFYEYGFATVRKKNGQHHIYNIYKTKIPLPAIQQQLLSGIKNKKSYSDVIIQCQQ